MRVLLISANREMEPYPVSPLGVAYLTSALKEKGHAVRILDLCFIAEPIQTIKKEFQKFQPDIVGLSIRNIDNLTYNRSVFYMPAIKEIVETIKVISDVPVVAGGSGFSLFPEETLKMLDIEYGIVGEGEVSFQKLLELLEGNCKINDIPGLCYIRKERFICNKPRHSEFLFRPDRTVLDNNIYYEKGGMANIQSKRGCPFNCSYCTYPLIDGKRLRLRPPEEVVDEMLKIKTDYGIEHIFFVDDIFNIPREHAEGICQELINKKAEIKWYCFATPLGMDSDLAYLMKMANCQGVEFGSDSGSSNILNNLMKNFTPQDIKKASISCKKAGLPDAHYILFGAPGEDRNSIMETVKLFDNINPKAVIAMTGIRIYPNTPLLKTAIEEEILKNNQNILEPVFYISRKIGSKLLLNITEDIAKSRRNWIVPTLNIRCDSALMNIIRKQGFRGPLWNML